MENAGANLIFQDALVLIVIMQLIYECVEVTAQSILVKHSITISLSSTIHGAVWDVLLAVKDLRDIVSTFFSPTTLTDSQDFTM